MITSIILCSKFFLSRVVQFQQVKHFICWKCPPFYRNKKLSISNAFIKLLNRKWDFRKILILKENLKYFSKNSIIFFNRKYPKSNSFLKFDFCNKFKVQTPYSSSTLRLYMSSILSSNFLFCFICSSSFRVQSIHFRCYFLCHVAWWLLLYQHHG